MEGFSLFDEGLDAAMERLIAEDEPRQQRIRRTRRVRQSGGLRAIAQRSAESIFGMGLRDLDREAEKTMPPRSELEAAYDAVRIVAGYDPDHAALDNRIGFARSDVLLGHALASAPAHAALASPGLALMVYRLAMRYRRQVPARLKLVMDITDQADFFD